VQGLGRRKHGKALRIDEARRWSQKAVKLAKRGDAGAVATLMSLLIGMRASEIDSRVVRDLDDDARLLWIQARLLSLKRLDRISFQTDLRRKKP